MMNRIRKYILPGLVFQSVIIGGGYATGRELIEFFLPAGPLGGVLSLLVSSILFGGILAISFEFARVTRSYDYRRFGKNLLGRGWVLFEIAYITFLVLVLSVIGAASGEMFATVLKVPPLVGTSILIVATGVLTFFGSEVIQRFLAGWSVLLYAVYLVLFIMAFSMFGDRIANAFKTVSIGDGWLTNSIKYTSYNVAILPAVLFLASNLSTRRETIGAGFIAGIIAIIPALLFYVAMMGRYPEIGSQPVPALFLISEIGIGWFQIVFYILIFGTFIETGTGLLHAVNERLSVSFKERGRIMPRYLRSVVSIAILVLSVYVATRVGIVSLIANGYGILTYVFMATLILPLLTIGLWKISVEYLDSIDFRF